MENIHKLIVTTLQLTNQNVVYDHPLQLASTFPFIGYKIINNANIVHGETQSYSDVTVQVKLYTKDIADIITYAESIDDNMFGIGLKRSYYTEMAEGDVLIGVLQYQGLIRETHTL